MTKNTNRTDGSNPYLNDSYPLYTLSTAFQPSPNLLKILG